MAIIMISRGTYSGGKALAERVAGKLGYPCLSREETLRGVIEKYGISEKELTAAMNEPPSFWQQVHGKRISYIRAFSSVLIGHIKGENLVYHGHMAHLMCGPFPHLLRVRVIADMAFRIKGAMARKNISQEEAAAFIQKIDRKRDQWTHFLYDVEWKDPSLYDVMINLEHLSIDAAAAGIVQMAEMDAWRPTPESAQALTNMFLNCRVWSALALSGHGMATNIAVTSDAGIVTISGDVASTKTIDAIAAVARTVEGVKEIKNNVGVGSNWYW